MTNPDAIAETLRHHARKMKGRDPHEAHRAATPLELLFDLTFVLAFSLAASEFAHAIAANHLRVALIGFGFASFGICWAWINFSWFASAYDTDDWIFRVATMVQMIGALIFATGLPQLFSSLEAGGRLEISTIVIGYVVMRFAMVFQWLRAAKQDPARRRACHTYAAAISIAQIGWCALIFLPVSLVPALVASAILATAELCGPYIAERKAGGTPWHAHHIAERYGLFAIIALGEGVIGTVAGINAVVKTQGWTTDAVLVSVAGVGLTFGMWWVYYILPSAQILHRHRERSFVWGYGQIITIAAIVATGAGLHVAAYLIEGVSKIGPTETVLSVSIPVGIFLATIYWLYHQLNRSFDRFHIVLLSLTAAVVLASVAAAYAGLGMSMCLLILTLAPVVTVVGYEVRGHRHQAEVLSRQEAEG